MATLALSLSHTHTHTYDGLQFILWTAYEACQLAWSLWFYHKTVPAGQLVVCWCSAPSATATSRCHGWTSRTVASTFDRLAIGCLCLGHGMRILFTGHGSEHNKHTSLSSSLSAPLCALPFVLLLGALYVPRPCSARAAAPFLTPSCCCCSRWLLFPRHHAIGPRPPCVHITVCAAFTTLSAFCLRWLLLFVASAAVLPSRAWCQRSPWFS